MSDTDKKREDGLPEDTTAEERFSRPGLIVFGPDDEVLWDGVAETEGKPPFKYLPESMRTRPKEDEDIDYE
jgi:hypothetical protein